MLCCHYEDQLRSYVKSTLRQLIKGVQANGQFDEDDLDDAVQKVRIAHEEQYKEDRGKGRPAAKVFD